MVLTYADLHLIGALWSMLLCFSVIVLPPKERVLMIAVTALTVVLVTAISDTAIFGDDSSFKEEVFRCDGYLSCFGF